MSTQLQLPFQQQVFIGGQERTAKPILKWAGGKTQLLNEIIRRYPKKYCKYIEPFMGGGAVFFALAPERAVIADSNPELINTYTQVAFYVDKVIERLYRYKNNENMFYEVREQNWQLLPPAEAAARMIYLNKTCFNGLYRVNRNGQFNVPFGRYKDPQICEESVLYAASRALRKAQIVCEDYLYVLRNYACSGDFIFLDPPYLPISKYSDFKRYTKEQFHEKDHIEIASEVCRLHALGCHVILTNSNHPLVHRLYKQFTIDIVNSRRNISCNGNNRKSEDIIVTVIPKI